MRKALSQCSDQNSEAAQRLNDLQQNLSLMPICNYYNTNFALDKTTKVKKKKSFKTYIYTNF